MAVDFSHIPFKQAKHYKQIKYGRHIQFIILHSMEAPEKGETAESVANYFATLSRPASAHYCLIPSTRILCSDLVWRPLSDMKEGDSILSTQESLDEVTCRAGGRRLDSDKITKLDTRFANCVQIGLSDGRSVTCSEDHIWLCKYPAGTNMWKWVESSSIYAGCRIAAPFIPWDTPDSRDAGYLAGIFDGEGCWTTAGDLSFAQNQGKVLTKAIEILDKWGIPCRYHERDNGDGTAIIAVSGLQANLRLLGQIKPERFSVESLLGRALRSRTHTTYVTVESVENVGRKKVVSVETGSRTFFAEGLISHNCVDNNSIIQCVQTRDIAYAAPGCNGNGIHIELAGYARQTRSEWLDPYGIEMLKLAAELCRRILMPKYQIPAVFRDAAVLRTAREQTGIKGITTHAEVTKAFRESTHTDPGAGFPIDQFIAWLK